MPMKDYTARPPLWFLFFLTAASFVPADTQCLSDIFRKRIRAQIVNDPFVPGMKLILFVEAGLLLLGWDCLCSSHFHLLQQISRVGDPGSKVQFKEWVPVGLLPEAEVSGVGSPRAETHLKQEMARVNVNILGISELKWTGMGEFNSDDH